MCLTVSEMPSFLYSAVAEKQADSVDKATQQ